MPYAGHIHLDLGSGDGRGPYRWASREPSRLFIASDANVSALVRTAWKAGRKPARGGVSNLICIGETFDVLSSGLGAVADRITVILPWGSLLRAVAVPELESLCHISQLCLPNAAVEIVLSYDEQRDAQLGSLPGMVAVDEKHITSLPLSYGQAGLRWVSAEALPQRELGIYETKWAKRLAVGKERLVWRIRLRRIHRGEAARAETWQRRE